jgi:hypothetical protein
MPNIREQSAPENLGINPTEMGVDARAAVARRGGAFYNQAAEAITSTGQRIASTVRDVGQVADDYVTHRDISKGSAEGTAIVANANTQWNQKLKDPNFDPNDPSTGQKFMTETLEPALDKFKEGFTTERSQQWAEQFTSQYRKHMFEKTSSDMATMAGIAVQQNVHKTVNQLSSAAASDPSSLDFALKTIDHSIGGMVSSSPNLDASTSAQVNAQLTQQAKEAVVKAAVSGMITKNPNIDLDVIQKKYGEFIKGDEMKMFQKAAQAQAKVDALQQKQAEVFTRQTNEKAAEKRSNDIVTKNVSIDPQTSRPIIKPEFFSDALDVAKMPDAPQGLARTLIDWGEKQLVKEGKIIDDPIAKRDLTDRLFDPDHPTTRLDLMKAQTAGKISDHTFQSMQRLVTELETAPLKGPVWQATSAAVKDALIVSVPGLPGKDSVGTTNYSTFMQTFVPEYLAKQRAGTAPPNALDLKDPTSMISQALAPFKRTQAQRMQDYVGAAGGVGAKPEPAVQPANQQTRMVGDVPVPIALNGVAALQFNKAKGLWRDQTSGTIYDTKGNEVKP